MDNNEEIQITANLNEIQTIINNLSETTFNKCVKDLYKKEKVSYNSNLLKKLLKKGELDGNIVPKESEDYIYQQYINAHKKFKKDLKVPKIAFGIAKINYTIYLYITKESSLSLNYIKNYKNLAPIDFQNYCEQDNISNKNISINSEMYGEAGMYINGYTFEFNINFFLKSLKDFIELPNLIFDLSKNYKNKEFYHELDISYYIKQKINFNDENIPVFKTSAYFSIKNNSISFSEEKNLEILDNSLIFGEVKLRFQKKIKSNQSNDNSLTDIIMGLFMKASLFYNLYKEMDIFDNNNKIQSIQLIFFYDYIQMAKINMQLIESIIQKECMPFMKMLRNIQIHFYIVYTLPSITTISISDLSNEIQVLKKTNEEFQKEIHKQNEKIDKLNELVQKLLDKLEKYESNFIKKEDSKFNQKSDNEIFSSINFFENSLLDNIPQNNDLFDLYPKEDEQQKQDKNKENSFNIFEDLFKTVNNDDNLKANSEDEFKILNDIFEIDSNKNSQEEQINGIDLEIINKFNTFLMKYKNNNYNKKLIVPPHKLNEEQINILNEFMDLLSYEELERIVEFDCKCKFCGTCKLKLSLKNLKKLKTYYCK